MAKARRESAGLLLWRRAENGEVEVLLAHPGGPFWARRDLGVWTVPKGEIADGEDPLAAARREFTEETGHAPDGEVLPLGSITQKAGKVVRAWAVQGDFDPAALRSNTFEMEWPAKSGKMVSFPEIDRVAFFGIPEARRKINEAQIELLDRLLAALRGLSTK